MKAHTKAKKTVSTSAMFKNARRVPSAPGMFTKARMVRLAVESPQVDLITASTKATKKAVEEHPDSKAFGGMLPSDNSSQAVRRCNDQANDSPT